MSVEAIHTPSQTFRIGAVSRLTGVTTVLIRVWERRYNVVRPVRTESGHRLYTQEDIARLALIKQLVDAGDSIGSVASLTQSELENRVDTIGKRDQYKQSGRKDIRIAVIGHGLTARVLCHRGELAHLELVGTYPDVRHLRDECEALKLDVVVIELPYVKSDTYTEIEQLISDTGATGAVVVYGFGSRRHTRRLHMPPLVTLRAPADVSDISRACIAVSTRGLLSKTDYQFDKGATPTEIQPRRYNDEKLARIATLSTTVECECPHHLADLVLSLTSFEQYSANCTNVNDDDAAMHHYLHVTTSRARALLETALARLVEVEGLEV